jgi:hypothetical protein
VGIFIGYGVLGIWLNFKYTQALAAAKAVVPAPSLEMKTIPEAPVAHPVQGVPAAWQQPAPWQHWQQTAPWQQQQQHHQQQQQQQPAPR